jgi:Protein of unknown function (DUF664)
VNGVHVLDDAYGRLPRLVHGVVDGVSDAELTARIGPVANTIAWLVWHLTRIMDDHIADAASTAQIWTAAGWCERFDLPFDAAATGYGQQSREVAALRAAPALLLGYFDAVFGRATQFLAELSDADLDRIVDESWDPPVTLGVRLVSVAGDALEHAGQAAFIRGVLRAGSRSS